MNCNTKGQIQFAQGTCRSPPLHQEQKEIPVTMLDVGEVPLAWRIYIYIHIIYSFCFERTQYLRLETSVRNQCALKLARTVCHSKFACPQCLHFSPFLIRSMLAACYRLAGQGKRDFPIIGRSSFSYSSEVLWLQSLRCTRNRQIPERDVKSAENVSC